MVSEEKHRAAQAERSFSELHWTAFAVEDEAILTIVSRIKACESGMYSYQEIIFQA
jgi:hypothetical protein